MSDSSLAPPLHPATGPAVTVVTYSKTGHSRRVADRVAQGLGVTPLEVTTPRYTWPVLGYVAAGRDAMRGVAAPIHQTLDLPSDGTVLLVGPVWAGTPAAPLVTVLDALAAGDQRVAVILTCGDPEEKTGPIDKVAARLGRPLVASLVISNEAQNTPDGLNRFDDLAAGLALAEGTAG